MVSLRINDQSPIQASSMKRLKRVLQELEEVPSAVNFLQPVPYEELGLLDYPKVIKTPMDLQTCR